MSENIGDSVPKITIEGDKEIYWKYGRAHETVELMACTIQFPNSVKDTVELAKKLLCKQLVMTNKQPGGTHRRN